MNKIKILTPDNVEIEYKLASLPLRAAAAGVDILIQLIIFGVFVIIGIFMIDIENMSLVGYSRKEMIVLAALLGIYGILMYGYYVFLDVYMKGQTIGKKLYHIRVIRENGEGISLLHAIIREFLRITIDVYGVGVIMVFFNKKYKRLGDLMASTIVVSEEKENIGYYGYRPLENPHNMEEEDVKLIKDFLDRYDEMNLYDRSLLEDKLIKYILDKYKVSRHTMERKSFLKYVLEGKVLE